VVLNPLLYEQLKTLSGKSPKVINAGIGFSFSIVTSESGKFLVKPDPGEQYAVNCPFCGDRRSRLYVHHRFGTQFSDPAHPELNGALTQLAFCQNEQKVVPLYGLILDRLDPAKMELALALNATQGVKEEQVSKQVPPLGQTIRLSELPDDHEAIKYLRGRGYDTTYLSEACEAQVSVSHPDGDIARLAKGRILFPFYVDGILTQWQGRVPYDIRKGVRWPPKWWFPPGVKKVPWNVDVAATFPVVILTEGILSAVNAGPAAIALGGKTMTYESKKIIKKRWDTVIVMLDPDAGINRNPDETDWQTRLVQELKAEGIDARDTIWTPGDNRDPGDIGRQGCSDVLRRSAPDLADQLGYL